MECNTLHMVNSTKLFMQIIASVKQGSGMKGVDVEILPVCTGCRQSYAFSVGADDFTDQIAQSKLTLHKLREMRAAAALKVQISYRGLAGRRAVSVGVASKSNQVGQALYLALSSSHADGKCLLLLFLERTGCA